MSAKLTIVVMCIILYSVNQVYSLKCYVCNSIFDGACFTDPKKEEFETECSSVNHIKSASTLREIAKATLLTIGVNGVPRDLDSVECYTGLGNGKVGKVIIRQCIDKIYSDVYIKEQAIIANVTVESISRCDTNLCNILVFPNSPSTAALPAPSSTVSPKPSSTPSLGSSSSTLSIGLFTVIGSLFLIPLTKL